MNEDAAYARNTESGCKSPQLKPHSPALTFILKLLVYLNIRSLLRCR